jgi:cytochrome c oxidase cbb3-type subunit 4
MDTVTLHSISPVLVLVAFIGICWWAYSPKRRKRFEEAAQLPFVGESGPQSNRDPSNSDQTKQDSP